MTAMLRASGSMAVITLYCQSFQITTLVLATI